MKQNHGLLVHYWLPDVKSKQSLEKNQIWYGGGFAWTHHPVDTARMSPLFSLPDDRSLAERRRGEHISRIPLTPETRKIIDGYVQGIVRNIDTLFHCSPEWTRAFLEAFSRVPRGYD